MELQTLCLMVSMTNLKVLISKKIITEEQYAEISKQTVKTIELVRQTNGGVEEMIEALQNAPDNQ